MKFSEVQNALLNRERVVEYQSLTSNKIHKKKLTIPRKMQSESDKILVWDITAKEWADVEVSTILKIS